MYSIATFDLVQNETAKAEEEERDMVDLLVEKDVTVVYLCDADGFTPLLRAAHSYRLKIAARILHHCPQSIKQFDSRYGRNLFHLINFSRNDDMAQVFNKMPQMKHLLTLLDNEKNTPLHVAIEQHRFGTAKFLMEHLKDNRSHYDLLNKDGKTAIDMLYQVQDCPRWFQDFLTSKWMDLPTNVTYSMYGVHVSYMKDYMGVIGVVAALLTTITFTAAFTVPGGYDQNKGTPIMGGKVAYQVFMVTDVVGMCSSMMVLFCLLWFLNSGRMKYEGSELVDLSLALLQISFYATLIAFMTGVYVTTVTDVHWLAIFTC
ncbi:Protein ACCELERATED CELL DEATH 6, partial [Bienertia sinuspersici]